MTTPTYYIIELKGLGKDKYAWFNTVHDASVFGSLETVAPVTRSATTPDGVQGKDYLITYSNYY